MTSKDFLIDSQVLVWLSSSKGLLGSQTKRILERGSVHFSTISVAELQFKAKIGRLTLASNAVEQWLELGFKLLSFNLQAAEHFGSFSATEIPDPMDRQIMAIARANNLALITSDRKILAQQFDWVLDATT